MEIYDKMSSDDKRQFTLRIPNETFTFLKKVQAKRLIDGLHGKGNASVSFQTIVEEYLQKAVEAELIKEEVN
jgi:hypothetical protein